MALLVASIVLGVGLAACAALDVYYWRRLRGEQAAREDVGRQLVDARGSGRFKVARLRVDLERLQAQLRGEVYPSLWVEGSVLDGVALVSVFADRELSDAQANAVVARISRPERV
jgi:hypothetical protein